MSLTVLLEGIYILASVFAVGVVGIESMGLLGDAGDHDGHALNHDGAGALSHDGDLGEAGSEDAHGEDGVVTRGGLEQRPHRAERYIFRTLSLLRLVVYFALGFGPMGLIAIVLGTGALFSLLLAIPVGALACVLYRSFIRFQGRDLDSTVHDRDLIGHQAKVLVAIHPDEIGRVRVTLAQMVCDRYATSDSNDFIPKGALVDILAINDRGLVVAMPLAS